MTTSYNLSYLSSRRYLLNLSIFLFLLLFEPALALALDKGLGPEAFFLWAYLSANCVEVYATAAAVSGRSIDFITELSALPMLVLCASTYEKGSHSQVMLKMFLMTINTCWLNSLEAVEGGSKMSVTLFK